MLNFGNMLIQILTLLYCLKLGISQVCIINKVHYPVGDFINFCRKCTCHNDGSWVCRAQCRSSIKTCPYGQALKQVDVEVLKGCFCRKSICADIMCDVRGKSYPPGPFISNCQKCNCNKDGSWNCKSQCSFESIKCPLGKKVTQVSTEVSNGCFCNKFACATNQDTECNVNGVNYPHGKFIALCRNCICNQNGSWSCFSLCPIYKVQCKKNQSISYVRKEVIPGCYCEKPNCVNNN
ncbi:laminin-like protein epi-1 isoform X2 [Hydra vulgaris]|uniref:Laminin-like protein epi-1 isoform X2 n=1 Tax=Hydra vulgaris TaxID=6087 RepID=A0ABM4BEA0_HYDVU